MGLFNSIRSNDTREDWEAILFWSTKCYLEATIAALQELAIALSSKHVDAAIEVTSISHHDLFMSDERVQERLNFITD